MPGVLSILRSHPVSSTVESGVNGVLSMIRSNPLSAAAAAVLTDEQAAHAALVAANPQDYAVPEWLLTLDRGLQYLRTEEGRKWRQRFIALLIACGGGAFIYKRIQASRARAAREAAAKAAHRNVEEEPEEESLGDKLVHPPTGEMIVASKSAGERSKGDSGDKSVAAAASSSETPSRHRVAVNMIFFKRLAKILRIVIPSIYSREAAYIFILTVLLFARTFFSIYIAELIGQNAQSLVSRRWGRMWQGVKTFAIITIPASGVNAGLKYFQEMVALQFRKRLSESVHEQYLFGTNFYKATNLGGGERIDNADQRVTADIDSFSTEIAALYAGLLKPLLDVVLFTYKLKTLLGWQGPAAMHSYFVFSGLVKRQLMPNLGKLVARESELEGFYRSMHNRLITNSEEIAFYDGSKREKTLINNALHMICEHIAYARYVKALVGVFDGLLVKYYASIAGYCTLLSPFIFMRSTSDQATTADLTRDYIRNSQYLGQLSTAVGQLVMVGNKLTSIAGYTSRVSELLEQVAHLNEAGNVPFEVKPEIPHHVEAVEAGSAYTTFVQDWKQRCDTQRDLRFELRHAKGSSEELESHHVVGGGEIVLGDDIEFQHVDIVSPEGKLLVHDLNFEVKQGTNVMITGPNGVGKSSLFRIIGELWPLHCGRLIKPHKEDILFVPQKPYLVIGTLRDQIIYPHEYEDMQKLGITDKDLDALLAIVDPARNITTEWQWDTVKDWFHAFSGGQKQRVAMARLFYHRPKFAILDECTSAVSDEVEGTIYSTCRLLGITIFTVSHRPQLAKYHEKVLKFEGETRWSVKDVDSAAEIEREKKERAIITAAYLKQSQSRLALTSLASSNSLRTMASDGSTNANSTTNKNAVSAAAVAPSSSSSSSNGVPKEEEAKDESAVDDTTQTAPEPAPTATTNTNSHSSHHKKKHGKR